MLNSEYQEKRAKFHEITLSSKEEALATIHEGMDACKLLLALGMHRTGVALSLQLIDLVEEAEAQGLIEPQERKES